MVSIAVLTHSPGVVYYYLLLRRETRIPGVAFFSFQIGIWDLFVHRGQKSYTHTAFSGDEIVLIISFSCSYYFGRLNRVMVMEWSNGSKCENAYRSSLTNMRHVVYHNHLH